MQNPWEEICLCLIHRPLQGKIFCWKFDLNLNTEIYPFFRNFLISIRGNWKCPAQILRFIVMGNRRAISEQLSGKLMGQPESVNEVNCRAFSKTPFYQSIVGYLMIRSLILWSLYSAKCYQIRKSSTWCFAIKWIFDKTFISFIK